MEAKYISAFVLGVMSSGHCLGMCGGISGAFGLAVSSESSFRRIAPLMAYNCGRISCYGLLGFLLACLGQFSLELFSGLMLPLRVIAALTLIAMACYVGQWWMGITVFERVGQHVWKRIQPLGAALMPLDTLGRAFAFGVLWGFLPCGLVYSMLVWTASSASPVSAALLMGCFGLGTLPAMLATAYGAGQLRNFLQHRRVRATTAILLLGFGFWTLLQALGHSYR